MTTALKRSRPRPTSVRGELHQAAAVRTALKCGACALVTLAASCLDAGPTPLGRHLVAGRGTEQVQFVDGAVGAPRRMLTWRTIPAANDFQVPTLEYSAVDDPGPGGGAAEARVIATGIDSPFAHCFTPACPTPIDALGRLYMFKSNFISSPAPGLGVPTLVRVDPATGTLHDFGSAQSIQIFEPAIPVTPSTAGSSSASFVAVDTDDTMTTVAMESASFAGNDLYGLTGEGELLRLPGDGHTVEQVATGVAISYVVETGRGPLIILERADDTMPNGPFMSSFLDATTRKEEKLPAMTAQGTGFSFSENGRYVSTQRAPLNPMNLPTEGTTTLTIYDRDTAQEMISTTDGFVSQQKWHPTRDEVWFDEGADLVRWAVGGQPEAVGHGSQVFSFPTLGPPSPQVLSTEGEPIFTPDGRFRVFAERYRLNSEVIALQSTDDPSAPVYELNQPSMGIAAIWPLFDGRLLVEDFIDDAKKNDAYIVDPVAQTQQRISSTGNVVVTGHDRCLALLHWVATGGSGDLTIVDYATGAQTLIAQNVHSVAVDAAFDASDALAPGTHVAFLVRNRIASPYDGLWMIDLP
jgi:hypothetical protein